MTADSDILTYIFLGFIALLFFMIFWNVLGSPRRRTKRRSADAGHTTTSTDGGADTREFSARRHRSEGDNDRHDVDDGGSESSGAGDGGGDGGGGGD